MTLREIRKSKGLTTAAVALALGIDRATVLRWERGVHNPSLVMLLELAALYRVPIVDLIYDETQMPRFKRK